MTHKRWIPLPPPAPLTAQALTDALTIPPALGWILAQRGVGTFEEARAFFRPQLCDLHDPFLMKDMDKAVDRLAQAISGGQKIMVYGDYDVDGTTAVAMFYSFLRLQNANAIYAIPDRYADGYGVSLRSIDYAASEGVALVVALDCGIKAAQKVRYAAEKGIDYIICDHHLPDHDLPPAAAVLNPLRPDCPYPCKCLSGCGVGFKLVQGFCQKNNIPFAQIAPFLDLAAVSIASDIVHITGENRTLAHYGLRQLNAAPCKGLRSIIRLADLEGRAITIGDIVFRLGPRINAAGRMESGRAAVDLLIAGSDEQAQTIGIAINEQNARRKDIDRSITAQAISSIKNDKNWSARRSIVAYNPHWHKGVVGIVASRLVEEFYRPAVVLTESNGLAAGSARSIEGFDLYGAIAECAPLLHSFGGHVYAAGLTLPVENVEEFARCFEEVACRLITPEMLVPQVEIDAEINFSDLTPRFCRLLKEFEPFGPGNMSPVFVTRRVFCYGAPRLLGSPAEHLKVSLVQEGLACAPVDAIGFGLARCRPCVEAGSPFDVCYTVTENCYLGKTTLQLHLKDIKPSGEVKLWEG